MTEEAKLIVAALRTECSEHDDCTDCPNARWCHGPYGVSLDRDAADLIESLFAELEQVKRERDTAVEDLRTFTEPCRACVHVGSNDICHECRFELIKGHHITRTNWQWRGVKEKED